MSTPSDLRWNANPLNRRQICFGIRAKLCKHLRFHGIPRVDALHSGQLTGMRGLARRRDRAGFAAT